jgi:hypothetical protein
MQLNNSFENKTCVSIALIIYHMRSFVKYSEHGQLYKRIKNFLTCHDVFLIGFKFIYNTYYILK